MFSKKPARNVFFSEDDFPNILHTVCLFFLYQKTLQILSQSGADKADNIDLHYS